MPSEELSRVVTTLLNTDPGDYPHDCAPLYCYDDGADLVAAMPVFNELGLSPVEGLGSPVMVSSGGTTGWEDS